MSSNKDFLPSSSPISSICAIEIEAILFLFMMNCYKSSFQECITITVLKIERTRNQPPYCSFQLQKKDGFRLSRSGCLGTFLTLPQSLYRRTYADVRTKIFRINGLPNLLTHGVPRALLLINVSANARATFEKVISMDLHCKNKNFAEESRYFRLRRLFCFCDN